MRFSITDNSRMDLGKHARFIGILHTAGSIMKIGFLFGVTHRVNDVRHEPSRKVRSQEHLEEHRRFSLQQYLHSYENRHVPRGIQFPRSGSQVSNRVIPNYITFAPLFLATSKSWLSPSLVQSERTERKVDRCCCQASLHEECEIRVLLREMRGRFEDGNIFRPGTIFAFAYITSPTLTLCDVVYISVRVLFIFILYLPGRNF